MVKKGDTLIEVCIAIGIFSLIAIGVASVMSSGTAGSQTALETTLAREEIDAQADALRFIHESYLSGQNASDDSYNTIWNDIAKQAQDAKDDITQFAPSTCSELYNQDSADSIYKQKAFILNTKKLSDPSQALVSITDSNYFSKFQPASTYPRLIFGNATNNSDTDSFVNATNTSNTNLYRAEGIYIVAVKDGGTEMIVDGTTTTSTPAFYDFYIRSCWYGIDADRPTTISTVIRLYDPLSIKTQSQSGNQYNGYRIVYHNSTNPLPPKLTYDVQFIGAGKASNLANPKDSTESRGFGHRFLCWGTNENNCDGEHYESGQEISIPADFVGLVPKDLYTIWDTSDFKITFDAGQGVISNENGNRISTYEETIPAFSSQELNYSIPNISKPKQSGWSFSGWCSEYIEKGEGCPADKFYRSGDRYGVVTKSMTFYAVWSEYDLIIDAKLTWGASPRDLDSHVEGQKSDGSYFHTYFSNKSYSEGVTIASLDRDVTSGYGPETITLHTLGGRNYYYYIKNWTSNSKIPNATVLVTVKDPGTNTTWTHTFNSNDSSGNGRFWNVFAYKDGEIVTPRSDYGTTSTDSPNTSY